MEILNRKHNFRNGKWFRDFALTKLDNFGLVYVCVYVSICMGGVQALDVAGVKEVQLGNFEST